MISPSRMLKCPSSFDEYDSIHTTVLPGIDKLPFVVSEFAVPTPELSLMISLVSPRLLSVTPSASTEHMKPFVKIKAEKLCLCSLY